MLISTIIVGTVATVKLSTWAFAAWVGGGAVVGGGTAAVITYSVLKNGAVVENLADAPIVARRAAIRRADARVNTVVALARENQHVVREARDQIIQNVQQTIKTADAAIVQLDDTAEKLDEMVTTTVQTSGELIGVLQDTQAERVIILNSLADTGKELTEVQSSFLKITKELDDSKSRVVAILNQDLVTKPENAATSAHTKTLEGRLEKSTTTIETLTTKLVQVQKDKKSLQAENIALRNMLADESVNNIGLFAAR